MEKHTNKARHSHNNNCKQPDINKSLPKFSGFQVAYIEIDIDMVEVPRAEYDELVASDAKLNIIYDLLEQDRYVSDDILRTLVGLPVKKLPTYTSPDTPSTDAEESADE